MLWFSKIDKSISYHFAAQKVLSIRNFPGPVSNVSCTAHAKALEKAANELTILHFQCVYLSLCQCGNAQRDA